MLSIHHFGGAQHETFSLELGSSSIALTLDRIEPLPSYAFPGKLRDPFSLLFRSSSPVVLPQRLYKLKNDRMGLLDIFLVPVARDKEGIVYEAVFN